MPRNAENKSRGPITLILAFFAAGNLLNGAWMLISPPHWYETLPAGVPDYGPMNEHFIRDIGSLFVLMGAALVAAIVFPKWRFPAVAGVTGFTVLHALVHVFDTARGLVGPDHWLLDLPAIYVPAVIMLWLTFAVRPEPE